MVTAPRVFISYAWESVEHRAWVMLLAERLRADGVESVLDIWETAPGDQLPTFMERAIRDAEYVLIVCTPAYKARSNGRTGGVGYEGDIITAHVLAGAPRRKFIPVLRGQSWADSAPDWLLGAHYIDLGGAGIQQDGYRELLNTVRGKRPAAPPVAGPLTFDESGTEEQASRSWRRDLGRDLTRLAREGALSPPAACKRYTRAIVRVLNQRARNNALLVGPPGVGKTPAIEGLALHIRAGEELGGIYVAGATIQMADNFPKALLRLSEKDKLIVVLENIHLSMGGENGALLAALRHVIGGTNSRIIGTTTPADYAARLKDNQWVSEHFTLVEFSEPSPEQAEEMVRHACQVLKKHHRIFVTDEAVAAAVRLAGLHVTEGALPGKALHLIDEACAYARFPSTASSDYVLPGGVVDEQVIRYVLARRLKVDAKDLAL